MRVRRWSFGCWQDLLGTKLVNLRSTGGPVKANPAGLQVLVFFDGEKKGAPPQVEIARS